MARCSRFGQEAGESELEQAARALAAIEDRENGAQAEILLADAAWRAGPARSGVRAPRTCGDLVDDAPSSPAKATVLSEVSRYHMLADRADKRSRSVARRSRWPSEFGLEEVRAHALNNIGTSRVNLGDTGGIGDLERSIEISDEIGSPESLRGYNNLFSNHVSIGDLEEPPQPSAPACLSPSGSETQAASARWLRFERVHVAYWEGRWDEAAHRSTRRLSEVGPDMPSRDTHWRCAAGSASPETTPERSRGRRSQPRTGATRQGSANALSRHCHSAAVASLAQGQADDAETPRGRATRSEARRPRNPAPHFTPVRSRLGYGRTPQE